MKKHYLYYIVVAISILLLAINVIFYYKTKGISSSFMSFNILIVIIEIVSMMLNKNNVIKRNLTILSVILLGLLLSASTIYMPRYSYENAKMNLEEMNWTVLENDVDTFVVEPKINIFITQVYLFKVKQGETIKQYMFNPVTGEKLEILE